MSYHVLGTNLFGWSCLLTSYAVKELKADVEREIQSLPEEQRAAAHTEFAVFVVHNKLKEKAAELPAELP